MTTGGTIYPPIPHPEGPELTHKLTQVGGGWWSLDLLVRIDPRIGLRQGLMAGEVCYHSRRRGFLSLFPVGINALGVLVRSVSLNRILTFHLYFILP